MAKSETLPLKTKQKLMAETPFRIAPVTTPADLAAAVSLFKDYARALAIDLSYQNFAAELAGLPGKYAPPLGQLLLARSKDDEALGCVALRPIESAGCCEMKRLYIAPQARGTGLGRALVQAILSEAIRIGYREIRLDTLPNMTEALSLYEKAGFRRIEPYYQTPVAGTIFLSRMLTA